LKKIEKNLINKTHLIRTYTSQMSQQQSSNQLPYDISLSIYHKNTIPNKDSIIKSLHKRSRLGESLNSYSKTYNMNKRCRYETIIKKSIISKKYITKDVDEVHKENYFQAYEILTKLYSKNNIQSRENKFMPNEIEHYIQKCNNVIKDLPVHLWLKILKSNCDRYSILYNVFDSAKDQIYQDQSERIYQIIQNMKNLDKKRLITMDGDGRICSGILRYNKDIKITVVDINKDVDIFHKCFFPKAAIESVCDNIITYIRNNDTSDSYIYLNFCGMSNLKDKEIIDLQNIIKKDPSKFMISFSIRGTKDSDKDSCKVSNFIEWIKQKSGLSEICHRGNFYTYTFLVQKKTVKKQKQKQNEQSITIQNSKPIKKNISSLSESFWD
jgi:hypothetical protein